MTYLISLSATCLLIGAVSVYFRRLERQINQRLSQLKTEARNLVSAEDMSKVVSSSEFVSEVTKDELRQMQLVDVWHSYRWYLITVAIGCGAAFAYFICPDID